MTFGELLAICVRSYDVFDTATVNDHYEYGRIADCDCKNCLLFALPNPVKVVKIVGENSTKMFLWILVNNRGHQYLINISSVESNISLWFMHISKPTLHSSRPYSELKKNKKVCARQGTPRILSGLQSRHLQRHYDYKLNKAVVICNHGNYE